jgi:hypothetical protein
MQYHREVRLNGKPSTEVLGGLITLCFATNHNTDQILRWMTKESEDDTWEEVDKMEEGMVSFYESGFDYPPTRTYKFNDALLIYFKEFFYADGWQPMQTIITISPAIQNYGTEFPKRWNVSWIPPSERMPYQPIENEEPKVLDYYITNIDNIRIDEDQIENTIILNIESRNLIGEHLTINLENKNVDFKYNGKVLPNDTITNYKITSNIEQIKLKVIKQEY